jgi:ssDNA thymidine ADP-ribosyltransferase, DarT
LKPSDLKELYYITPIANVPSILEKGILSHNRARKYHPVSVAMPDVQERRDHITVFGRPLHSFVNLYIDARNPMMFKRKDRHEELCVLRIDVAVLRLHDLVIASGNAAHGMTNFFPTAAGLSGVETDRVFAEFWTHSNPNIYEEHKRIKCAEVLIPDNVEPSNIEGAFVSCKKTGLSLRAIAPDLKITKRENLFFLNE